MTHSDFKKATNFPCGALNKGRQAFEDTKTVANLIAATRTIQTQQTTR